MANQEGCPRCKDYESIKEQLENEKSQRNKDIKDKLKVCEDRSSVLQKKLMMTGAAAVIGGTILGKDFVDKIAEYINSFNSVKNAASGLIGAAPPASVPPVIAQIDPPKEEKEEKEDTDKDDPWVLDVPEFASTGFDGFIAGSALAGLYEPRTMFDELFTEPIVESESVSELLNQMMTTDDLSIDFMLNTPPILLADTPVYPSPIQEPFVAIVPAPGFLAFLPFVLWFGSRRRRR